MNSNEAAALLGVSSSTISRLVAEQRRPSWALMEVIEDEMGWAFIDQVLDFREGVYAQEFRKRMEKHVA